MASVSWFMVFFVSVFLSSVSAQSDDNPVITLAGGGMITGVTIPYSESQFLNLSKSVDAFLGVPFAQPPVGDLRFAYPKATNIQGNYNATYSRAECPQFTPVTDLPGIEIGREVNEDCLYLSIYTPSPKPTSLVPVFVWIHGGGYVIGGGSELIYQPLPMVVLSDIIVVNVNYRLGAFGYLTTGDDVARGNYGMLDQVMALQWVQDNIEAFGGDPRRVTIGGESAGGSSVSLLSLSPLTDGLFHQTIMQSGNALCPWSWATQERGTEVGRELAETFGCPTEDSSAMIACLRQVPERSLTEAQLYLSSVLSTPIVDGYFLLDHPMELINRRQFKIQPTLMGTNEDEGAGNALSLFPGSTRSETPPVMNISFFRSLIPSQTYNDATDIELAAIENEYVDWSVADDPTDGNQIDGFIRLNTDISFSCPTEYVARALEAAGAEIYRYEMTHDPSWSVYAGIPKWLGAAHAEDLQYVFTWGLNPAPVARIVGQSDEEKAMSVQFIRYWANFVISGSPNGPLDNGDYPEWPRYTMPGQEYKKLSLDMANGRAMRASQCSLWRNFLPGLRIQADPIDDIYEDWQDQYERWKTTDVPSWMTEFEDYKQSNSCPTAVP
ncbi:cholinesterase 1 [Strongylocentrotus purpuratus]|uniref:Carboxylic ester hydrolase n=1 Tax=Strongylocentrotus purpuratus TaxID=7668 RepID=A0A7M7MX91_STRPU|nr:cholinesterase 1 [Strongylocentrotus purpuratus]